ncbi:hypothetical protein ACFQZC_24710 [Streptacidiphilus monticola]
MPRRPARRSRRRLVVLLSSLLGLALAVTAAMPVLRHYEIWPFSDQGRDWTSGGRLRTPPAPGAETTSTPRRAARACRPARGPTSGSRTASTTGRTSGW